MKNVGSFFLPKKLRRRPVINFGKYIKIAEELKDKNLISKGKYEELLLDAFRGDIVYGLNTEREERYD